MSETRPFKDFSGNNLKKGFYQNKINGVITFFSGKYHDSEFPVCETPCGRYSPARIAVRSYFIRIPDIHKFINQTRQTLNWLEQILSNSERGQEKKDKTDGQYQESMNDLVRLDGGATSTIRG